MKIIARVDDKCLCVSTNGKWCVYTYTNKGVIRTWWN